MKILANLIISAIVAAWIGAIAVFSIQNIEPVSLQFLLFETIELPIGVLLAFCLGIGLVIGAIVPLLWQRKKSARRQRDPEFDF
ncbi:MAG: lipopolysaccharide assembly protein LapA domain-containing protein [Cyanophyceae cyanobacterium]